MTVVLTLLFKLLIFCINICCFCSFIFILSQLDKSKNGFQDGGRPLFWILKISIFGHVTVIGFNICCSAPNLIKIGRFFTDIAIYPFLKWRPSTILDFKNLQFLLGAFISMPFCFLVQNFAEIGQSVDELWPKTIFKMAAAAIMSLENFHFWSCDCHWVQYMLDYFWLRYGDLAIFKMAAVRHLGFIITPQYCIAGHIFVVQILS